MSYVAFKRDILDAFDGEPVAVKIDRREQSFGVELSHDGYMVHGSTTDRAVPNREARRAWALALFKDFVETVAEHKRELAADALHERFGASVQ